VDHSRFVAFRRIPPDIVPTAATTAAKPQRLQDWVRLTRCATQTVRSGRTMMLCKESVALG